MIAQHIYLEDYHWSIKAFFADDKSTEESLLTFMEIMGCTEKELESIENLLMQDRVDIGFTYTDYDFMTTIMYIGPTSSIAEFQNTFDHEKGHACIHIASYYGIDPYGEEYQYLAGEIGERLFDVAKLFICK